jgi:hypothetical protein
MGISSMFRGDGLMKSLSHFVAKFANVLNAPPMVVNSGRDKNATKLAHDNDADRHPAEGHCPTDLQAALGR